MLYRVKKENILGDNMDPKVDREQDRDSINSFRTIYLTIVPIIHFTKLPGYMTNNTPLGSPNHTSFKARNEVDPEDSALQVSKDSSILNDLLGYYLCLYT